MNFVKTFTGVLTNTKRIKKKTNYIGLRNLGSLCYLNSIIQHLFRIPQFKYSILGADDKNDPKKSEFLDDDNMLHQLQKLFTFLSFPKYTKIEIKKLFRYK